MTLKKDSEAYAQYLEYVKLKRKSSQKNEIIKEKKKIILEAAKQSKTAQDIVEEYPQYFKNVSLVYCFISSILKKDGVVYAQYLAYGKLKRKSSQNDQIIQEKKEIILEGVKRGKTLEEIAEEYSQYFISYRAVTGFIYTTLKKDSEAYKVYLRYSKRSIRTVKKKEIILEAAEQRKTVKQVVEENPEYFKSQQSVITFINSTLKRDSEAYAQYLEYGKITQKFEKLERKKQAVLEGIRQGKTLKEIAEENSEFFMNRQNVSNFISQLSKRDSEVYEEYLKYRESKIKKSNKRLESVVDELAECLDELENDTKDIKNTNDTSVDIDD